MPRKQQQGSFAGDRSGQHASRTSSRFGEQVGFGAYPVAPSAGGAGSAPRRQRRFRAAQPPAATSPSSHRRSAAAFQSQEALLQKASPAARPGRPGEHRGGCQQAAVAGLARGAVLQNFQPSRWRRCSSALRNQVARSQQQLLAVRAATLVHRATAKRGRRRRHCTSEGGPSADGAAIARNELDQAQPQPGARHRRVPPEGCYWPGQESGMWISSGAASAAGVATVGLESLNLQPASCTVFRQGQQRNGARCAAVGQDRGGSAGRATQRTAGPAAKRGSWLWRRRSSAAAARHQPPGRQRCWSDQASRQHPWQNGQSIFRCRSWAEISSSALWASNETSRPQGGPPCHPSGL